VRAGGGGSQRWRQTTKERRRNAYQPDKVICIVKKNTKGACAFAFCFFLERGGSRRRWSDCEMLANQVDEQASGGQESPPFMMEGGLGEAVVCVSYCPWQDSVVLVAMLPYPQVAPGGLLPTKASNQGRMIFSRLPPPACPPSLHHSRQR